jgi:hypothetical protein
MSAGDSSQSDALSKNKELLTDLLKRCAILLTERGIIESPAYAAVVRLDVEKRLNQYFLLHCDWVGTHMMHPLHLDHIWDLKHAEFMYKRNKLHPAKPGRQSRIDRLLQDFANVVADGQRSEILKFITTSLKALRFYCSVTEDLYKEAKIKEQHWNSKDITPILPLAKPDRQEKERAKVRAELEKDNHCQGDWVFGVYLENLYLNSSKYPYYSVYFVKHPADNFVYAIVGCCKRDDSITGSIACVGDLVAKSAFNSDPLSIVTQDNIGAIKLDIMNCIPTPTTGSPREKYEEFKHYVEASENCAMLHDLLADKRNYCSSHSSPVWPIIDAYQSYDLLKQRHNPHQS